MRKPININNCVEAGYIKKTHGVKGSLHLALNPNFDELLEELDFLFFKIDGLPVPFFIEEIFSLGNGFANVQFKTITTKEQAQSFIGYEIMTDKDEITNDSEVISPNILKGFLLIDQELGEIGEIVEVSDFGGNIVFSVAYKNEEVMIPFNEELLVAFDRNHATITLNCPEGILDLSAD